MIAMQVDAQSRVFHNLVMAVELNEAGNLEIQFFDEDDDCVVTVGLSMVSASSLAKSLSREVKAGIAIINNEESEG